MMMPNSIIPQISEVCIGDEMRDHVKIIQQCNQKFSIALTGGCSEVISELLRYGGSSNCFIEGIVPYNQTALQHYIQYEPEKFCSAETARRMSMTAWKHCKNISKSSDVYGFAATCSLAKADGEVERAGRQHSMHMAVSNKVFSKTVSFNFPLVPVSREIQERQASEYFITFIEQILTESQYTQFPIIQSEPQWNEFYNKNYVQFELSGGEEECILPGSFNPIHKTHLEMAHYIYQKTGKPVALEISMDNVDKAIIDHITVEERINEIKVLNDPALSRIYITLAPTFAEKSKIFPNKKFLVGFDTIYRIGDPKYYKNEEDYYNTIKQMVANETKFILFHRQGYDFELTPLNLKLKALCEAVPYSEFYDHEGVSSSKIRQERKTCTQQ